MDPRANHALRFTIEPYSAKSDGYSLSYAFWQRELNETREMIEQVQNGLRGLIEQVHNELRDLKHLIEVSGQTLTSYFLINKLKLKR